MFICTTSKEVNLYNNFPKGISFEDVVRKTLEQTMESLKWALQAKLSTLFKPLFNGIDHEFPFKNFA